MTHLLVLGDALLDRDWTGRTERLCPDSSGPVFDLDDEVVRPGGAALAAVLARQDGDDVTLVTAIGPDAAGGVLRRLLDAAGVHLVDLGLDGATPEKIRLRVQGRSLARVDRGGAPAALRRSGADVIGPLLAGCDGVLASDYGRRLLDGEDVRRTLARRPPGLPLVWDPHPRGRPPVRGTTVATPNRAEGAGILFAATGRPAPADPPALAAALASRWAGAVALTCGSDGLVLAAPGTDPQRIGTVPVDGDPCGAGDCFASTLAAGLARGRPVEGAVVDAQRAATAYVGGRFRPAGDGGAIGLARRVRASGGTVVAAGGCFDVLHAGHVRLLQEARRRGDCLIVCLNSDASVGRLKGPSRPVNPEEDRRSVLLGLGSVDEVEVFDEDDPCAALRRLRPHVFVKGEDYAGRAVPEESVLAAWGGRLELVPLVAGRSTSRVLRLAAGAAAG